MSRKEGKPPRKKEIPLRLCSSASLREKKIRRGGPEMQRDRHRHCAFE